MDRVELNFTVADGVANAVEDIGLGFKAGAVAGRVVPSSLATDKVLGVNETTADTEGAFGGNAIRLITHGKVRVRIGDATAVVVGDFLEPMAGGKFKKRANASAEYNLVAQGASTVADTLIDAILR